METDRTDIHPENVAGEFFVNDQCITCDMCFEISPEVFRMSSDSEQSIVYQQPKTEDEKARALEVLENCPVEAIENSDRDSG